jgi:hypothetical protein
VGRKKSLPDHSKEACKIGDVFDDDKIKHLIKEFMFNEEFPLRDKLEDAIEDYQLHQNSLFNTPGRDTPAKEQKILLGEIYKRTELLHEVIKKIGLQEDADISKYLTIRGDSQPLLAGEFADQIFNWNRAARKALKDLDERTSKGGRPSGFIVRRLIRDLHEIYRNGTGREDRITTYPDPDREDPKYGGRFYDFVESCFKTLGIFKSNSSLGKAIEKSLITIP